MAENSAIEWCDATFNAWIGCQKVSPACDHCYAERQNNHRQWVSGWGPQGERRRTSKGTWAKVRKWQKDARAFFLANGRRLRVFVNSLSDVFDNQADPQWRADLFETIRACPDVDFLLLTKRPQNIKAMLPRDWFDGYPNVWLGVTVENQAEADRRIPPLLAIPAAIRFLSVEPLLGPLDLYNGDPDPRLGGHMATATYIGRWWEANDPPKAPPRCGVDWVIVGGESGPNARPLHPHWVRSLRDQCEAAEVPFFFKQWGEHHPSAEHNHEVEKCKDTPEAVHISGARAYQPSECFQLITTGTDWAGMCRLGKKNSGRTLDGRIHSEFPASVAA